LKRVFEHLPFGKRQDAEPNGEQSVLESRAIRSVRDYLDAHAANLERAVRLEEKAERLEEAGIPSESARNRAERARGEIVPGLVARRASFVERTGHKGGHAFDGALKLLCPVFASRLLSDEHPH
jgi:hypothetical protein